MVFCIAMAFVKVFPDPYHKDDSVDLWTWIYREFDELLHGEYEDESVCD